MSSSIYESGDLHLQGPLQPRCPLLVPHLIRLSLRVMFHMSALPLLGSSSSAFGAGIDYDAGEETLAFRVRAMAPPMGPDSSAMVTASST